MKPGKRAQHNITFALAAEEVKRTCPGIFAMLAANDTQDQDLVHIYYVAASSQIHEEFIEHTRTPNNATGYRLNKMKAQFDTTR